MVALVVARPDSLTHSLTHSEVDNGSKWEDSFPQETYRFWKPVFPWRERFGHSMVLSPLKGGVSLNSCRLPQMNHPPPDELQTSLHMEGFMNQESTLGMGQNLEAPRVTSFLFRPQSRADAFRAIGRRSGPGPEARGPHPWV